MRRDLLRPKNFGRFWSVPLPRIVDWQKEVDGQRDVSELLGQFYPVREDVIPHLKQILEAFNGVEVNEAQTVIDTHGPGDYRKRIRELSEQRMRGVLIEECERADRAIVMWYKMEETDHPVMGTHQRVLTLRVLTVQMLSSWEY